jgi:hypothetical protein
MRKISQLLTLIIFWSCLLAVSPVQAALVGHWKFDDGSGTAPTDSSGNNITGAFNGSTQPTWSTDVPSVSFSNPYSLSFT